LRPLFVGLAVKRQVDSPGAQRLWRARARRSAAFSSTVLISDRRDMTRHGLEIACNHKQLFEVGGYLSARHLSRPAYITPAASAAFTTGRGIRVAPIGFTNTQLEQLKTTAAQIPPWQRDAYLRRVVELLTARDFSDADVRRAALAARGELLSRRK
jgi:hypothetical protein